VDGPRQLWTHSFGVAIGAQLVAQKARLDDADAAFTAGLLHDLGKVALSVWLEDKVAQLIGIAIAEGVTFDEAERRVLGFDHTEVGEYLAESWNLPSVLTQAIRYHHQPNLAEPPSKLVDAVHVGDYLTMTMGFGLGADGLQYEFFEEALERLKLSAEDLDTVTDSFVLAYEGYESMFMELQVA